MIVYGSGLSDGNEHLHHDLPVMVAGRGSGSLHPGRHIRYPVETPLTNLYMTLLSHMGDPSRVDRRQQRPTEASVGDLILVCLVATFRTQQNSEP